MVSKDPNTGDWRMEGPDGPALHYYKDVWPASGTAFLLMHAQDRSEEVRTEQERINGLTGPKYASRRAANQAHQPVLDAIIQTVQASLPRLPAGH